MAELPPIPGRQPVREVIQFFPDQFGNTAPKRDRQLEELMKVRDFMIDIGYMFWDPNEGPNGTGHGNVTLVRADGSLIGSASQRQWEKRDGPGGYCEIVVCNPTLLYVGYIGENLPSSESMATWRIALEVSKIIAAEEGRPFRGLEPGVAVLHPHGILMHQYADELGLIKSIGGNKAGTSEFSDECGGAVARIGQSEGLIVTPGHQGEFVYARSLERATQIMVENRQRADELLRQRPH